MFGFETVWRLRGLSATVGGAAQSRTRAGASPSSRTGRRVGLLRVWLRCKCSVLGPDL